MHHLRVDDRRRDMKGINKMAQDWVDTKAVLLQHIERDWQTLNTWLASLDDPQWTTIPNADGWTIKDHVAHLTARERAALYLLQKRPAYDGLSVSRKLYVSTDFDAINHIIFLRHKEDSLVAVRDAFHAGHEAMLARLATMTDEALMQPCSSYVPDSGDYPIIDFV